MACRCGGTFLTPILAIAGLVAAGAAGYRVITGGCGTCSDKDAKTTLVSTTTEEGHCGLCPGESSECSAHVLTASATEPTSCCMEGKAAKVTTVAAEPKAQSCCMAGAKDGAVVKTVAAEAKTETKKEGCCSGEKTQAAECTGVSGCEGEKKDGCCSEGKKEGEKKEEKKAEGTVAGK